MHQFSINTRVATASRWPFVFLILIFVLSASLLPVCAQEKADPAPAACVPSDLNASIVPEGPRVLVNETKDGFDRDGRPSRTTVPSGSEPSAADMQKTKEAYRIFSREAQQGNPAAMVNLAVASLAGWGVRPNAGAALYWLKAAADRGYGAAFYNLGILYFKGCGVRQDDAQAFHFFDLGARSGYAPAQVNLGYFYDHGLSVRQDHAAAAHWYLQAAESGEAQAQYNLGDLYLHGEGVAKDESTAFAWFQKAALQGHAGARLMVGSMLAAGRGMSKDLAGAYFWIFTAVLQGDGRGAPMLRVLELQLTAAEIEHEKSRARLLLRELEVAKNR